MKGEGTDEIIKQDGGIYSVDSLQKSAMQQHSRTRHMCGRSVMVTSRDRGVSTDAYLTNKFHLH